MAGIVKEFKENPGQKRIREAQQLHKFTMAYGGSRSGKTFGTVRNMTFRSLRASGARMLIAKKTFSSVKKAIIQDTFPEVMSIAFPSIKYNMNKTDWFAEFTNGSQIWFAGLDDKERIDKILGTEYVDIFVNEATEVPFETIETLKSRLAQRVMIDPLPDQHFDEPLYLANKMYFDCNPKGKKHWTYTCPVLGKFENGEDMKDAYAWGAVQVNPQENRDNLPEGYIEETLGSMSRKQRIRFLEGEFQPDNDDALWKHEDIIKARDNKKICGESIRTLIAVDPAVTSNKDSDETGIVVTSIDENGMGIVEGDYTVKARPDEWGRRVVMLYHRFKANGIVAEKNQGGDLIRSVINSIDPLVPVELVHASKGKETRAEPIVALYEQGKIAHKPLYDDGDLGKLEDEMMDWVPLDRVSPNRIDALVWGFSKLMVRKRSPVSGGMAGPKSITV